MREGEGEGDRGGDRDRDRDGVLGMMQLRKRYVRESG